MLTSQGVDVYIGHDATQVPEDTDLLVYSDAIPTDNLERIRARELGIPECNYFEALGRAAEGKKVIAVSGTHGKTTTTAMIGKVLIDAGEDPAVIVGSIVSEWKSNFRAGQSDLFVVEACEYRKHFLNFHPRVLVITNIEYDHTDFFATFDELVGAFREAAGNVEEGGSIVCNAHDASAQRATADATALRYDYSSVTVPVLLVPGEFNRDNARAAKLAVHQIAPHIPDADIDASLASFRGTWRRFEYKGPLPGGAQLYDDYAHHPTAITKTIAAAREQFPQKKIVIFFHPHLYSRTRDLWDGFVEALATADETYLLPVYAAREAHDPSVSSSALAQAIRERGGNAHVLEAMHDATQALRTLGPDTVAFTMGAGDVYTAGEAALA
jgi:UDP-N-acetylmuramate--alanine ligase